MGDGDVWRGPPGQLFNCDGFTLSFSTYGHLIALLHDPAAWVHLPFCQYSCMTNLFKNLCVSMLHSHLWVCLLGWMKIPNYSLWLRSQIDSLDFHRDNIFN